MRLLYTHRNWYVSEDNGLTWDWIGKSLDESPQNNSLESSHGY